MPRKELPELYTIWQGMKRRCDNPNFKQFMDYGGRGIKVCDRWVNDYWAFEADMLPRPPDTSIDRIDVDGDYAPENCRWATRSEQQRNRRDTRKVNVDGTEYRVADLAELSGKKGDTIIARAKKGLSYDEVVSQSNIPLTLSDEHKAKIKAGQQKSTKLLTHCKAGHLRTKENTHITPQGWRTCKDCRKESRKQAQLMREAAKLIN